MKKHVAVLLGGLSSEREVSLRSGAAASKALKKLGYKVSEIDVGRDLAEKLKKIKPDLVFNALHGTYGEDGCVQGLLELLQIPYTHSGVLASAMAMDKPTAKVIFESVGIRCAPGKIMTKKEIISKNPFKPNYVIKPPADGSSVGVIVINKDNKLNPKDLKNDTYLVEKFIAGTELSVAVMDGKALGAIEIRPKKGFYDYKNKYTSGMTEYILPAEVSKSIVKQAMDMSEKAHRVLGCRGISRSDIRYNNTKGGDGKLYMLELNTHPGMTELSLVPKIANYVGISFEDIIDNLVKSACCDNV